MLKDSHRLASRLDREHRLTGANSLADFGNDDLHSAIGRGAHAFLLRRPGNGRRMVGLRFGDVRMSGCEIHHGLIESLL